MARFCSKCGTPIGNGLNFCVECGSPVDGIPTTAAKEQAKATSPGTKAPKVKINGAVNASVMKKAVAVLGGSTFAASPVAGEIVVGGFSPFSAVTNILNPLKTILDGVKRIFTSFKNAFKNKKGLIAAIILAVVWILLTLLPMFGINPFPVQFASWLTFAQGGLKGGVLGFIGGIAGKGMFATLIFSLFSGGFKGAGSGFKKLFSAFRRGSIGMLLVGIGAALVLFNLMAGVSSPIQSMAGITGFLLSLKALAGGGFMRKLATSLTANKNGNMRTENTAKCTALLSGLSFGFAASTVISLIPWGYLPYCLGAAVIVAGVILGIVLNNKKGVSAQ